MFNNSIGRMYVQVAEYLKHIFLANRSPIKKGRKGQYSANNLAKMSVSEKNKSLVITLRLFYLLRFCGIDESAKSLAFAAFKNAEANQTTWAQNVDLSAGAMKRYKFKCVQGGTSDKCAFSTRVVNIDLFDIFRRLENTMQEACSEVLQADKPSHFFDRTHMAFTDTFVVAAATMILRASIYNKSKPVAEKNTFDIIIEPKYLRELLAELGEMQITEGMSLSKQEKTEDVPKLDVPKNCMIHYMFYPQATIARALREVTYLCKPGELKDVLKQMTQKVFCLLTVAYCVSFKRLRHRWLFSCKYCWR